MNEEEKKAIERLKHKNLYINIKPKSSICIDCINENKNKHIEAEVVINEELELAIETVLNLLEKQQAEIKTLKTKLENQKIEYQSSIKITNSELLKRE